MHALRTAAGLFLILTLPLSPFAFAAEPAREQVLVVPHTHWEGAVFKTREEYLQIGLPNIVKALYLLKKYPDYRFVLDQMCYVKPFLERYPAEVADFRRFLAEGRLQIAGGTDTMHDNNIPSGESIVRQYLLGKSFFRESLGYDVTTGWGLDTFGHNAQMPQILKLAGMKSYWFQRGVPGITTPSEFLWQGLDGTRIPAFWLPLSYAPLADVPSNEIDFQTKVASLFDSLTPFSRGPGSVLLAGADVSEPEERLPAMLDQYNRSDHPKLDLRLATPSDFEALVSNRANRPVITGELNPVFQGIYSSRIEVKQAMRNMERLLTTAEKFSVMATAVGAPSSLEAIERGWEPVLFNQAHDLSSGVMVDKVYDDSMQRYEFARQTAEDVIARNLTFVAAHVKTSGEGVALAIFNTLGWARTDAVEADIAFSDAGVRTFHLVDSDGKVIPHQALNVLKNEDGTVRQARVVFLAREVPALGYAVYHAVPGAAATQGTGAASQSTRLEDAGTIENQFYRASFNLWSGEMTSLRLKENNWEVLAGPGNVVAREYDGGDFWELYGTLNGGRFTAMKKEIPAPRPAYTQRSNEFVGGSGEAAAGPVFSEFHISHPFGKNQFATRVRMYSGVARIDIRTELTNREELVRYRMLLPTSIKNGSSIHEIPFGAIERPERQEFPAQNWIHYGDGEKGVALLNRGLPGNNVSEGTMMLSLMRSARLISYGFIGGYEPGVGSDTGLGLDRKYVLDYSIVPHTGDWRAAAPWRAGLEFNNPLIVYPAAPHAGELPSKWEMVNISDKHVVVSSLKLAKDGATVLRVYEAAGLPAQAIQVHFQRPVQRVQLANLIEDGEGEIQTVRDSFKFDLRPFEIKTFKVYLDAAHSQR